MIPVLVVAAVVVATSADARAGARRPRAKIEIVSPISGQRMSVTLTVRDAEERDLPIRIEYRIRGVKGWFPATIDQDLSAVPSSEVGETLVVSWNAYADLGTRHSKRVRLRTIVDLEKGRKKKSKRFEVYLYGSVTADAVSALTYPDLRADGRLDEVVLIDTRDPHDFAAGHLPGAIHVSTEDLETNKQAKAIFDYPKDTHLVFYCYGGL